VEFLRTRSAYYLRRCGGHEVVVTDCVMHFLHSLRSWRDFAGECFCIGGEAARVFSEVSS